MAEPGRVRITITGTYLAGDTPRHRTDGGHLSPEEVAAADKASFLAGDLDVQDVVAELANDGRSAVVAEFGPEATTMTPDEMLQAFSAAVDEIYRLRRALAYEALSRRVDLGYATFPKSRRLIAEAAVARMQAAVRGERTAYADIPSQVLRHALTEAGADECLTNHQLQVQLGLRNSDATVQRRSRWA